MFILITNDDGISAPGINALARELEKYHEVIIVAPDDQRSACSHSITLTRPLAVREVKLDGIDSPAFSIDGTPADCVRLAIDKLIDRKVDMVVSGINRGFNIGMDVLYSGTVSAAIEASINKIPSIAVSTDVLDDIKDYETAAVYAGRVLDKAIENGLKNNIVLNINVPKQSMEDIKGIKVCPMGSMVYGNYFVERQFDDGKRIYDIMGNINEPDSEITDTFYITQGYVTLTPLHYDLTNFKLMSEVGKWF